MATDTSGSSLKHIVIIGGGFAGVNLARKLLKSQSYFVTLVDKNDYNFFPPLLYQLGTGFLDTSSICYPFRKLFRYQKNFQFRMGELQRIDAATHTCYLNNGELQYDYLVIAAGAETNYFGNKNIQEHAIPMKTVNDALNMRNVLLQRAEEASHCTDLEERKKLTTVVIAGGGATGVEIAGMLAELLKYNLKKDFPELVGKRGDIHIVNGGGALLEPMSEQSQKDVFKTLDDLGVKIWLNTRVKDFADDKVIFSDGNFISTKNLIWAAGITARVFEGIPKEALGRGNRINADSYNKIIGVDDIYVLGDICIQTHEEKFAGGHPQVAQTAIQQAQNLAKNFIAMHNRSPLKPFHYIDKGSMAIVGKFMAVADLEKPKLHFRGFIALNIWLFIHVMSLINYRNRLKTLYNWAVAYFTNDHSLRMIIRPEKKCD